VIPLIPLIMALEVAMMGRPCGDRWFCRLDLDDKVEHISSAMHPKAEVVVAR
jgi:hypothetical protein